MDWWKSVREIGNEIEDISQIDRQMVMDNDDDSTHTGPVLLFLSCRVKIYDYTRIALVTQNLQQLCSPIPV